MVCHQEVAGFRKSLISRVSKATYVIKLFLSLLGWERRDKILDTFDKPLTKV